MRHLPAAAAAVLVALASTSAHALDVEVVAPDPAPANTGGVAPAPAPEPPAATAAAPPPEARAPAAPAPAARPPEAAGEAVSAPPPSGGQRAQDPDAQKPDEQRDEQALIEQPGPPDDAAAIETGSVGEKPETHAPAPAVTTAGNEPSSPVGEGIRKLIEAEAAAAEAAAAAAPPLAEGARPPPKTAEERDRAAMQAFYEARNSEPIWVADGFLTERALNVAKEISLAGEWGLDAASIVLPALASKPAGTEASEAELAEAELAMSRAVLKYHLLARGGAIYDAPKQISSYLDRRPKVRDRRKVLEDIAAAEDPVAYLLGLHPQHPEFKRLHQAWLEARKGKGKGKVSAEQLLANMQQWRWMPEDMGEFHVWLNVPEYMIRIVDGGKTIFDERVTVGLVNKQTPIFSDEIERITFKSRWRVPDSIKVKEVWPSLLKGGGMMRQHGLIMMKGEEEVDWRQIDWSKASMEDYTLWQPPGPINQLGLVKFSFPNKHYVFMHDTPDKHMFAWTRRANSHGCMRIRNPLTMATLILNRDKGWDRAKIDELVKEGPEHNIIELEKKVPVHISYLTVRIDEAGKIQTFPDIYGHEKRVRQALAGEWTKIAVGPDHLAPLDQTRPPRVATASRKSRALREPRTLTELMFGGN